MIKIGRVWINEESFDTDVLERLEDAYYYVSESYELYDPEENQWYNSGGQKLRDPKEYDPTHTDCFTPFGDE